MHPAYFETRFRLDACPSRWPEQFVIVSAWATTGEHWPRTRNESADRLLEATLNSANALRHRVTGYSPATGHAEPSWAFPMEFNEAFDLGMRFFQDAIYCVDGDCLSVTHCDHRRGVLHVGSFRDRIDLENNTVVATSPR